jgi:hypothetical protein
MSADTMKLFQMLMQSPAFQQLMTNASLQGNQLSQSLTQGLAQRGLTTSGVGTVAQRMGQSMPGYFQGQAKAGLFNQANQSAMESLMQRLQATTQLEQQRRAQKFNPLSLVGAGLGTFGGMMPFLGMGSKVLQPSGGMGIA